MKSIKVFDTSSIVTLIKEIERPDVFEILFDMGYKIEIPLSVFGEIKKPLQFDEIKIYLDKGMINIIKDVDTENFIKLKYRYPRLGNGEIEVLSQGKFYENDGKIKYLCVIDDGLPREVAKESGVNYTGTFGVLDFMSSKGCFSTKEIALINERLDNCRVPKEHRLHL